MSDARSILVLYGHPYPDRSRAGRALLAAVSDLPGVSVRSLYDLYPDFFIDAEVEQAALVAADVIVFQAPLIWYGLPPLMSLWIEKVLAKGWAYGSGRAVAGKRALWVTTTGGPKDSYAPGAMHGHPFDAFIPAIEQTARFCGMEWEKPLVVHGATRVSDGDLADSAELYRDRLVALSKREVSE